MDSQVGQYQLPKTRSTTIGFLDPKIKCTWSGFVDTDEMVVSSSMPFRPRSRSHQFLSILDEFQNYSMDARIRQWKYDYAGMPEPTKLPSLAWLAKRSIARRLGRYNLHAVKKLELPETLKLYLMRVSMEEDVEFSRTSASLRTFKFNHQHANHKVHRAMLKLDDAPILIKVMHLEEGECTSCRLGSKLIQGQHSRDWMQPTLPYVLKCYSRTYNPERGIVYFLIEHPVIGLSELCFRFREMRRPIPEHIVWDFVAKSLTTARYLEERLMCNNLYETCHFVCVPDGTVKLENLLLYMSTESNAKYTYKSLLHNTIMELSKTGLQWRLLTAVRALSLVYYEMVVLQAPRFVLDFNHHMKGEGYNQLTKDALNKNLRKECFPQQVYSKDLIDFILSCLQDELCGSESWFNSSIREAKYMAIKTAGSNQGMTILDVFQENAKVWYPLAKQLQEVPPQKNVG